MNGDPPIDNATVEDEREFLESQGFAKIALSDSRRQTAKSLDEHRDRVIDGDLLRCEIEQLARRIAIDMLDSPEFTNRIEGAIITRAVGIAKRATFELLESSDFKMKVQEVVAKGFASWQLTPPPLSPRPQRSPLADEDGGA